MNNQLSQDAFGAANTHGIRGRGVHAPMRAASHGKHLDMHREQTDIRQSRQDTNRDTVEFSRESVLLSGKRDWDDFQPAEVPPDTQTNKDVVCSDHYCQTYCHKSNQPSLLATEIERLPVLRDITWERNRLISELRELSAQITKTANRLTAIDRAVADEEWRTPVLYSITPVGKPEPLGVAVSQVASSAQQHVSTHKAFANTGQLMDVWA